jgi:hypothetical protein
VPGPCKRCGLEKPGADFYVDPKRPGGYTAECKACIRDAGLERRYGRPADELRQYADDGECAICGDWGPRCVDHDHEVAASQSVSASLRDGLCGLCNRGLGNFRDSPELLERAAEYVRVHDELLRYPYTYPDEHDADDLEWMLLENRDS